MFEEIDVQATIKNAKKLLKKYPIYKRRSVAVFESKVTPSYSFEPKSYTGTVSNAIEKQVVSKVYFEQKVDEIESAINKITDMDLRRLLIEKYTKLRGRYHKVTDRALQVELSCSEREFYRIQKEALLHFADVYNDGELQVFVS